MSKSLGNYVGIDEPPQEMFGKVMSVSDDLMWRYYELLTDISVHDLKSLRDNAARGSINPRDIKATLAKKIITDFHSKEAADAAEGEFNRVFRSKDVPDEIEERAVTPQQWKLPRLLVELGLAPSMAEARRLIEQGGVRVNSVKITRPDEEVAVSADASAASQLIQVGKRRFLRVRGA